MKEKHRIKYSLAQTINLVYELYQVLLYLLSKYIECKCQKNL